MVSTRDGSVFAFLVPCAACFGPAAMAFLRGEPGEAGASARTGFTVRFLGLGWWRAGDAGILGGAAMIRLLGGLRGWRWRKWYSRARAETPILIASGTGRALHAPVAGLGASADLGNALAPSGLNGLDDLPLTDAVAIADLGVVGQVRDLKQPDARR